jgi:hypothetical protein
MKFKLECSCGKYHAEFDYECTALTAAELHILLDGEHEVICTRPAHFHPGSVPIIVFTMERERVK